MDNLSSQLIPHLFPDRPAIYDTLFHLLPYVPWTQYLTDLANIFSCVLLAWYLFPRRWPQLPRVLAVLGLGYFLRSLLILINPFAGPLGNEVHYGITHIHQYGQFPSGHMFLVVAIYLLIGNDAPKLKAAALVSIFIETITLLLSHGHYSIDIVGGFFLAYFAFHVLRNQDIEISQHDHERG